MRKFVWITSMAARLGAALFLCSRTLGLSYTISFDQVDWLDNQGGYTTQMSDWGFATIRLSSADVGLFQSGPLGYVGYLNITTTVAGGNTDNWAVQNMPLWFASPGEMDLHCTYGMDFDLGITPGSLRVGSLSYDLTIDPMPRSGAPSGLQTLTSVGVSEWLFGGIDDPDAWPPYSGNTGNASPGRAMNFVGASLGNPAIAVGNIRVADTNVVVVEEDKSGCAPGAATRSLFYLKSQGLITFSNAVSGLYDSLKGSNYMKTSYGSNGTGTHITNFVAGKDNWARSNDVSLMTTLETNIWNVQRALTNGADIEFRYSWWQTNESGVVTNSGGHMAFLAGITILSNGGFEVRLVDDGNQGSVNGSNRIRILTFGPDGVAPKPGGGREVQGFIIETIPEPSVAMLGAILALVAVLLTSRYSRWRK